MIVEKCRQNLQAKSFLLNLYQVCFTEGVDVRQLDLKHRVERRKANGDEFGWVAAIVSVNLKTIEVIRSKLHTIVNLLFRSWF